MSEAFLEGGRPLERGVLRAGGASARARSQQWRLQPVLLEFFERLCRHRGRRAAGDRLSGRDDEKKLAACDDRYYANDEPIADWLFEWIGNNRARIQLP